MIGTVTIGKSFSKCIGYCLEDKRELSEVEKEELSIREGVQHKNRAEVLEYSQCFGNKKELAAQFRDVRMLNQRVEKPVIHISLRVAPGDHLSKNRLIELGRAAVKEFGVEKNQYITILHKDTKEQHIHIVANRVGYDGKVASDSHNYRRMASLCRHLEKQYDLKQVLSPRRFLTQEERLIPRHDARKETLKENIQEALHQSKDDNQFETFMIQRGYQVLKGRGISFIDKKKVKVKGSELGYSLQTIERILKKKQAQELKEDKVKKLLHREQPANKHPEILGRKPQEGGLGKELLKDKASSPPRHTPKHSITLLEQLMKKEQTNEEVPYELSEKAHRQRRSH